VRGGLQPVVHCAQGLEIGRVVRSGVELGDDVIDVGGPQTARERRERHDPLAQRVAQQLSRPPQTPRRAIPPLGRGPAAAVQAASLAGGDPEAAGARMGGHVTDDIEAGESPASVWR